MTMTYTQSVFSSPITSTITLSSPWGVTPICPSTIISQSEASIEVTWSSSTNQQPPEVPGPLRGTDRPEMGSLSLSLRPCSNEWCHMSAVTCCSFIATTQAEHHGRVPGLSQHREHIIIIIIIIMITGPHLHTLIIMWTLVHTALNRIQHSWEITARDKIMM